MAGRMTRSSLVMLGVVGIAAAVWRSRGEAEPSVVAPVEVAAVEALPCEPQEASTSRRLGVVRLLGQCSVEVDGRSAGGWSTDTWALLGLLAEHRTSLLTREAACAKLWPDEERAEDRFAGLLKGTRAKLCEVLGLPGRYGRIVIEFKGGIGYRLNPDWFTCDVWQIRDLLAVQGAGRGRALGTAASLYTGRYLLDVPHGWARKESDGLNRAMVQAHARLADLEQTAAGKAGHLERATALDPAAEHLLQERMRLYAQLDQGQAVHYCYDELVEALRARGRKPTSKTEELYRKISESV
ncbi:AfsR/SARP family transcriptional regulator [Actinocorallia lasiicapitis]